MVVRFFLFETRGGQLIREIEPSSYDWSERVNVAETVNVSFVDRPDEWRNLFTPWKHSIAVDDNGHLLGGPIVPSSLNGDDVVLRVTARGLRHMASRWSILPVEALNTPLAPDGVPDTSLDVVITGVDHGTIGKHALQTAHAWPGRNDIPITYHADRPGTRSETYTAVRRKRVESAFTDLSNQEQGPDIRLQLRRTSEDTFGWEYQSGTEEQPRLQGEVPLDWEPLDTSGLGVDLDPSRMGSIAWSDGGRSLDKTLIRMLYDPFLIDRGFPLLELDSDASTSTTDEATLDSWNVETLRTARNPWDFWSFRVSTEQAPLPHEYGCGDLATVHLIPQMQHRLGLLSGPTLLSGSNVLSGGASSSPLVGFLEPRPYTRRIAGLSGDSRTPGFIRITTAEAYDG
ncbi:MAG: hypothetical protein K0S37_1977 [Microbacterium sp.]|jgi:hypothetical protein|nr:hypothetical protein [Microbacterium sp.]